MGPIGPARMPLMDHLQELRRRLTIVVVSVVVTALVVYFATPTLIAFMIDPIRSSLNGTDLTILGVLDGFTIRFKVAMFWGVIICTPIIIWEIMAFFLPALNERERKWVVPTVAAMVALFFLGMIFCYVVIQQAAFGWLIDQSLEFARIVPNADDYLNIMMLLEIGFGFAFQLPLIIFYLSILHIVPYSVFRSQWRYIYVGLMVVCAIVTPDASPITMILMYVVLLALYEVSLAVARYVITQRDGKEALKWSREEYAEHEAESDSE